MLLLCSFCRGFATRAMASDRSPDMDLAGPSYAPDAICISPFLRLHRRRGEQRVSAPLPGTFFGPTLDITSEKLCDLAWTFPTLWDYGLSGLARNL